MPVACVCVVCTVYLFIDSVIVAKGIWTVDATFPPFSLYFAGVEKERKEEAEQKKIVGKKTTARQLTLRYSVAIKLKHYSSPRRERERV